MTSNTLPDSVTIGAVRLRVRDAVGALALYRDLFGLHLTHMDAQQIVLAAGPERPPLLVLEVAASAVSKPPRTTGLFHVAIRLPTRSALARVLHRLAAARYPLQGAADHLVSEALYLADPDGNGLELYVDRPRDQWPMVGDQVQMATDPLDVDDLLAQASDDPWTGIDPGTDIGHIHLQVSDLMRAEAFWSELIGFEVMQRGYPGALFVAAGGYHHHVGLNTWAGRGAPSPPPGAVGLVHFALDLPDDAARDQVVARLDGAGVTVAESDAGPLARDADGNTVVLRVAGEPGV